jgi:hypothetical protein
MKIESRNYFKWIEMQSRVRGEWDWEIRDWEIGRLEIGRLREWEIVFDWDGITV